MTEVEERLGWAIVVFTLAMLCGPLAGSSIVVALIALGRTLVR